MAVLTLSYLPHYSHMTKFGIVVSGDSLISWGQNDMHYRVHKSLSAMMYDDLLKKTKCQSILN